ncbi:dipeptidase [Tropicimonas sediminicola]|uniref:Membrane dipeptidase n=1 Tax=Tropicimonas sediminicola TaxID=1031541 RepID=A0A239LJC2_9RHOB|nr:membrane dipeptidase [Tropicimonas sediminicola]SNT29769.1 membrane dipeptidase [Tropicimonas sediminicola]
MKRTTGLALAVVVLGGPAIAQSAPSDEEIAARIEKLVEMADPRGDEARRGDLAYRERYADAFMIDALAVGSPGFESIAFLLEDWESLADHYEGSGFAAFSTTISNGSEGALAVLERIDVMQKWVEENAERFVIATTVQDLRDAKAAGKVAIMLNSQSMDMLDENLENVQRYWDLGIRQMNFSYNQTGAYSAGMVANDPAIPDNGVTELGYKVVAEMNRVGMIVDCSHSSWQTCLDAAEITAKPMMISHSNSDALFGNFRNVTDAAIRAVAATGGVVCVNFLGGFLNPQGDATPKAIAKHIDYIGQMVGKQATCFGVDYVENYGVALGPIISNPEKYPPAQGYGLPTQMAPPADAWAVAQVLEDEHGWSEAEIRALMGENLMRVYEANWGG